MTESIGMPTGRKAGEMNQGTVRTTNTFPVMSPTYEVCQMRRTSQRSVERLEPGDLVRFVSGRVNMTRGGDNRGLYTTDFVIERLEGGQWVPRSVPLSQGNLGKRIRIVTAGDPYEKGIFERWESWERPLVILRETDS
jgi:hypothetical protein